MAIDIRDIQIAQEERLSYLEPAYNAIPAKIIAVNGSIFVNNRPNFVWVSEFAQPESRVPAILGSVAPVENLPVLVAPDPKHNMQRKIIGVYTGGLLENETEPIGNFELPLHAHNHQMPSESNIGIDPVKVYQPAIQPFKTTRYSGFIVEVQSYIYNRGGIPFLLPRQLLDISSYAPAVGDAVNILIYLDLLSGYLSVVVGVAVPDSPAIPTPLPAIPSKSVPSAFIRLTATTLDDIRDARDLLGGSSSFTATDIGQVLISVDGISFEQAMPLTNDDGGWMVNDQGLLLVI
jgi:hypothetical protein